MIGNLATAIEELLTDALPTLVGSEESPVSVEVLRTEYVVDPTSADALAGEPRPDDRRESRAFDPLSPEGPYLLSMPPYPGPRRVYLENGAGERIALGKDEVVWDVVNPQQFTLAIKPHRDVSALDQLTVLYGVTAIFTTLKARNTIEVKLTSSEEDDLLAAEALAVSIMQLNREALKAAASATVSDGDYTAETKIKQLLIHSGKTVDAANVTIVIDAESEVKASRALQEDEGAPIEHITSQGAPLDPDRPVIIEPIVEA